MVYEDLPAVVDPEEALKPGAPQLHDDVPGNCPVEAESGVEAPVMEAIAKAAHVTKLTVTAITSWRWRRKLEKRDIANNTVVERMGRIQEA